MVATSGVLLGGGLFGVLSHSILATATTFTVDETTDEALSPSTATTCVTATGHCSLRAAIQASNNAGGSNVITLPANANHYILSSSLGELQVGPAGSLTVTINGGGPANSVIQAVQPSSCVQGSPTGCFRVFDVDPALHGNVSFTVNGVTIEGGRTGSIGGAAIISGTNSASPFDTTVINNSVIHDNVNFATSTTTGGAVGQTYGSVTVTNSTFSNNGAGGGAGGALIVELGNASLSVSNSTFDHNTASAEGGAIFIGGSATDSITGSTFTSNTSTSNSGGVDVGGTATMTISSSTFSGNAGGRGGAVKVSGGTTTLTGDTFSGNSSTGDGGALAVEATATVNGSTFTGNAANSASGSGGAVFVDGTATATVQYNRLYQNTAHAASQVFNTSGGTTSAPNDWWGSNAGPSTGISGFTVSVWQVLTSTASPSTILVHQTSTITASTDTTNTNATIAPGHHIPNVAVTFANGTLGTVSLTTGTITSGSATTTYTAGGTGGIDGVPTTVDAQTVNGQVTVDEPPHITSANNATFLVGASVSCSGTLSNCFHVTATGFPVPTFSESGALPSGVTLASNGTLSGNPAVGTGGVYTFTITATNGVSPDDTQSFTLTVNEAPSITSANNTTFTTGQAGTFTVTSRGYPLPTITLTSGSLPSGVTYNATTHVLSGTPADGTGGQYALQFTSHNGIGSDSVQSFTLTIDQPAAITSANATTFTVGQAGTFSVTTTGFPAPSISETGSLPSGVTLHDNGNGTATLAGTPATGTGGTYSLTITAHNGVGTDATQSFTLTVDEAPSVTSANHTTFTTGQAGTFSVTTGGFPNGASMTITETGTLPSGVTFTDNGNGTATLAGTPAAGTGGTYSFTITASNGVAPNGTQLFTLTVDQPPAITSADHTTFTVGSAGTFSVTTSGFPTGASMTLTETGALPSGVTFTDNGNATATLAGTPAAGTGGTYTFTITANNGVTPNGTQSFTLTVDEAPSVTSANHTTFTTGQAGTFSVTTGGFPNGASMSISETGALPSGVTFTDNGDGTATLAGTPAAGTGGTYSLTITASNGVAPNGTQLFTLTVDQPPAITSADNTTFTVGQAGTFTVTTSGFPTGASMTITETGALPSGVTFTDNGDGTATLAGTPGNSTAGDYALTLTANNGVSPNGTQAFTLHVLGTPHITSADHTTFVVGQAGTFTVTTTGSQPMVISDGGATLPGGVTFTDNGDGTATLAGTPASGTAGTYSFTITASNGLPPDATQSFTLQVNQAPAITSADHTTFTTGQAGTFSVTTTGTPVPSISDGFAVLPSGVTFVDNGNGTATLSGTPAAGTGGTYSFTITAQNGVSPNATQSFTLTVDQAPSITSADHATFTTGSAGTFTVQTTGFPVSSIDDGLAVLPSGVTFVDNGDGTATLSGTPASGTGGSYSFTITASNGVSPDATQPFTLTVDEAPSISSANNTTFTVGTAGSFEVDTSGFPTPSINDGGAVLPSGVTFTDNGNGTATLAGTPAVGAGGLYSFTITAQNGVAPAATQPFTLTVNEAPSFTSADNTTFIAGSAGTFTVTTDGFPAASLGETGALPAGVTFTDNGDGTATLAGTPATGTGGVYPLTLQAQNGSGTTPQSFTLTVNEAPSITSVAMTTFTVGTPGTFSVTTVGYPIPQITELGSLPSGVTFTDNHDRTATLSGTPQPGTGGIYGLTINAANTQATASQPFQLTVDEAPTITSANNATFITSQAGTFTVTATGFPTPSIHESGTLPANVTFVDNGNGTATLSGTPPSGSGGTYHIGFLATNSITPDAIQDFTLAVDQPAAITSANSATFTVGSSGTFTVTTTGFPTPNIGEVGPLPNGVTFVDNGNGTGTLQGTPAAGSGGQYSLTFTAHNGVGSDAAQPFTLTVLEAPAFTSANTTTFQSNTFGSFTVTSRGFPTNTLSESGALPSGVTFTDNGNNTGTLSGTPTSSGTFPIQFTATNGVGSPAVQNFTLIVGAAPTTTTVVASTTTPTYGQAVTFTATVAPVSPATGTPAGTVTFSVDGVAQTTVNLSGGQAQWTTSSLQQGPHTIRADYNGQPNVFKTSFGTVNVTVGCATTYTGTIRGGVSISGGSACINNAKISGGVTISNGASVSIVGSNIGNGISASGARMIAVCGDTTASGSITISGTTGFVLVGGNNDDAAMHCGNNSVGGGITLSNNSGGFELGGNTVKGAVTVNNNVLSVGTPLDAENASPEIEGNTIKGSLSCSGNNPAPTDDLQPNKVSGGRSGQCGASNF